MKWSVVSVVSIISIVIDQMTKQLIHDRFRWGEAVIVIPGFFDLTHMRNRGAAFSLFDDAPPAIRDTFFKVIPVVAAVGILVYLWKLHSPKFLTVLGLSLILGGALGNFVDRLRYGYVVDFLYFHWKSAFYWPAFNVADSCIVVGVGLLYFEMWLSWKKNKTLST